MTERDLRDTVANEVARFVNAKANMGLAVGVVSQGEAHCYGFGPTALDGPEVHERTLFEIGSITKTFTTTLLADMHLRGELNLDDPVNRFLPTHAQMPGKRGAAVTLRHLATHSAGLSRLPPNMKLWKVDMKNPYARYSVDDLYAATARGPKRKPGNGTAYSNYGMGLLGHVLELASGMSYEQLVIERIGRPLGMPDTVITLSDDQRTRLAPGHHKRKKVSNWDLPTLAGAGALRSTISDMTRFAQANMKPETTPLAEAMTLAQTVQTHGNWWPPSPAIAALAAAVGIVGITELEAIEAPNYAQIIPAIAAATAVAWYWPPTLKTHALGWQVSTVGKDRAPVRWHDGGTGGYGSYLAFIPGGDTAVVLLSNTFGTPDFYGRRLLKILADS